MSVRPNQVSDNAQAQLSAGINASSTTFLLGTGEGATFPTTITGQATSAGDQSTLNSTGIGTKGLDRDDWIYNKTQDAAAKIISVSTDSATTTRLIDRDGNYVSWGASDEYVVRPFVITITSWSGTPFDGAPDKLEKVFVLERTADTLNCFTSTNRGYSSTTPQSFASGDYVTVFVEQESYFETWRALAELQEKKADDDLTVHLAGTETITGQKTFDVAPTSNDSNPGNNDLITKAQAEALVGESIDITLGEAMGVGQPFELRKSISGVLGYSTNLTDSGQDTTNQLDVTAAWGSSYTEMTSISYDSYNDIYLATLRGATGAVAAFKINEDGTFTAGTALTNVEYNAHSAVFDPIDGKFVLYSYRYTAPTNNQYLRNIIVDPVTLACTEANNTTISTASSSSNSNITFDLSTNKFFCTYRGASNLEAIVFDKNYSTGAFQNVNINTSLISGLHDADSLIYDTDNSKYLIMARPGSGGGHTLLIVGITTGSAVPSGSPVTIGDTSTIPGYQNLNYDETSNKYVAFAMKSTGSYVFSIDISGGTISADSGTLVDSATSGVFRSSKSEMAGAYSLYKNPSTTITRIDVTFDGTTFTIGTPAVILSTRNLLSAQTAGHSFAYSQNSSTTTQKYLSKELISGNENIVGILQTGGNATDVVQGIAVNGLSIVHSGLTPGAKAYATKKGVTEANTGFVIGRIVDESSITITKSP